VKATKQPEGRRYRRGSRTRRSQAAKGWAFRILFLAPALLFYAVFVVYAFGSTVAYSLFNWSGLGPISNFVGLGNYTFALTNTAVRDEIGNALLHNAVIFLVLEAVILLLGLGIAYLLTVVRERVARVLQVVYFIPMVMPTVILGYLWGMYLTPGTGVVSRLLSSVGLHGIDRPWLGDTHTALLTISFITAWAQTGYFVFIFVPALNAIPRDLLDAARVDGASSARAFRSVIVPLIAPTLVTATGLVFIVAFGTFDYVYVLEGLGGDPQFSTDVMATLAYRQAFGSAVAGGNSVLSMAATLSVIGFLIVLVVSALIVRLQRRASRRIS
jgi:raffinose/stachyose/melibiose transport system permease protein